MASARADYYPFLQGNGQNSTSSQSFEKSLAEWSSSKSGFFCFHVTCFQTKQGRKAHIFYFLSADVDQVVTSVEVEDLCKILLECYVTALKKTILGSKWKLMTNPEANHRFAKNAVKDLLGKKADPSCVALEEFLPWFNKFPMIENLFLAVMRACFLDVESLVEEQPHGLVEGCEETVAHVQYDRSVKFAQLLFTIRYADVGC